MGGVVGKQEGDGLNIRDMSTQNKSHMMKWLWKFVSPEVSAWKEVTTTNMVWRING